MSSISTSHRDDQPQAAAWGGTVDDGGVAGGGRIAGLPRSDPDWGEPSRYPTPGKTDQCFKFPRNNGYTSGVPHHSGGVVAMEEH